MKLPKTLRLVVVEWEDATHQDDEKEAPLGTMRAYTAGFVISNTKKELRLCAEFFEDGGRRDITCIPKLMVRDIQEIARIPVSFHASAAPE